MKKVENKREELYKKKRTASYQQICFITLIFFISFSFSCTFLKGTKEESGEDERIKMRRRELIALGGFKTACTYTDFVKFQQYKANLHCHSYHSDGSQYCDETAAWYYNHGYDVISISDHDAYGDQDGGIMTKRKFQTDTTVVHDWDGDGILHETWEYRSGVEAYVRDYSKPAPSWVPRNWQLEKPGEFIILNGVEYSFGHPHINAINHPEGAIARPRESYNFIDYTHAANGLTFLNHPYGYNKIPERVYNHPDMKRLDGLEVFNGFTMRDNRKGDNPDGSRGNAEPLWDGCLDAGLRFWGFANDDAHNLDTTHFAGAGSAWNMIWARELTREAIMDALRNGAFYGSCGIKIDKIKIKTRSITVKSPNATYIKVVGDGSRTLKEVKGSRLKYVLRGDEKWIRIIFWNDVICYPGQIPEYTQKAFLQPIILEDLLSAEN